MTGDLDSADINYDNMALISADDPLGAQTTATSPAPADTDVIQRQMKALSLNARDKCIVTSAGTVDPSKASYSVSCKKAVRLDDFNLNFEGGVKDFIFNGINFSVRRAVFDVHDFQVTPFGRVELELVDSNNQAVTLSKEVPLFYVQFPIRESLGFLRIDLPFRLDVAVPLLKFRGGMQASLAYSSVGVWKPQVAFETPVATIGDGAVFKYKIDDGHIYLAAGPELVLAKSVKSTISAGFGASSPDRFGSAGVFLDGGLGGSLSLEVASLNAQPCFKWGLQGKAGFSGSLKLGSNPSGALSIIQMTDVGPAITGSVGCLPTGFWVGQATIENCGLPAGAPGGCNFLSYNLNVGNSAGLAFATNGGELNVRLDQQYGCIGTTSSISKTAGSRFTYSLSSSNPFQNQTPSTTTYTITNVTDSEMSGTLKIDYGPAYDGTSNIYTATGRWRVTPAQPFPKCLLPAYKTGKRADGTPYGGETPSFFCPSFGDYWECHYLSITSPARATDWPSSN